MAKYRTGLHKEIASIFGGGPVLQKNDGSEQAPQPPAQPEPAAGQPRPAPNQWRLETPVRSKQSASQPNVPGTPPAQRRSHAPQRTVSDQPPKTHRTVKAHGPVWWRKMWKQVRKKLVTARPGVDPRRQKAMTLLVPVLLIVFIFVLTKVLAPPSQTHGAANLGPTNVPAASDVEIDWEVPAPYPATLRDPMGVIVSAGGQTDAATSVLVVRGTVYGDDHPLAVVGTQIVREGDVVSGATVVRIDGDSVEFKMNGKRWTQKVQ
jgi:hypothetical protein